jgi:DNA-binding NtrC family response regulator
MGEMGRERNGCLRCGTSAGLRCASSGARAARVPSAWWGTPHQDQDGAFIGRSTALREVLRTIERVAPTNLTVLILGERGTGKELVARALVARSRRRARPFVALHGGALPPGLLAHELFGHERGAFPDAITRWPGLLTAAHGGTLFLDEVGELPPEGQRMLLRFLQQREVRPLGGRVAHHVDVRVIAATQHAIGTAARAGTFHAGLHDRLNEVAITVPPLRERPEDIRPLAEHFLTSHAARHGLPRPRLSAAVLALLHQYPWPGNALELEYAMERAVIFSDGVRVRASELELDL